MSELNTSADTKITRTSAPGWPVVATIEGPAADVMRRYENLKYEEDGNFSVRVVSNDATWAVIELTSRMPPQLEMIKTPQYTLQTMQLIPYGFYTRTVKVRDDGSPMY